MNPIQTLKERLLESKKNLKEERLAHMLLRISQNIGSWFDLTGKTYDVYDKNGDIVFTIKQRTPTLAEINVLAKLITETNENDEKIHEEKMNEMKGKNKGRKR